MTFLWIVLSALALLLVGMFCGAWLASVDLDEEYAQALRALADMVKKN